MPRIGQTDHRRVVLLGRSGNGPVILSNPTPYTSPARTALLPPIAAQAAIAAPYILQRAEERHRQRQPIPSAVVLENCRFTKGFLHALGDFLDARAKTKTRARAAKAKAGGFLNSFVVSTEELVLVPDPHKYTDAWHRTKHNAPAELLYIPNFKSNLPLQHLNKKESLAPHVPIAVTFAPLYGPGTIGVAATELLEGRGLRFPDEAIAGRIPSELKMTCGRLVIDWPGYTLYTHPLALFGPNSQPVSRIQLAQQIAQALFTFAQEAPQHMYDNYSAQELGYVIPLTLDSLPHGSETRPCLQQRTPPGRVRFNQLRLLEVVSVDGKDWYIRVLVVAPLGGLKI